MEWVERHLDVIIALFGAGGAGAIILARLLAGKEKAGKPPEAPPAQTATATASDGGVAAAHGGRGDIHITMNETAKRHTLESLRSDLGLSLHECARLLKGFEQAGPDVAGGEATVRHLAGGQGSRLERDVDRAALIEAVRTGQEACTAAILARVAQSAGIGFRPAGTRGSAQQSD